MSNPTEIPAVTLDRIETGRTLALRIALGGLVGSLVIAGLFEGTGQFLRSYLASYVWVFAFGLGSLVLLMIQNISGGVWGYAIRRLLEAAAGTLPALAVLFLPVLLGVASLERTGIATIWMGAILGRKRHYRALFNSSRCDWVTPYPYQFGGKIQ